MSSQALANLEDNLLLFFTGYTRSASDILRDQDSRSKQHDRDMTANLHLVKQLGYESKDALETGDLRRFADLMHLHWENKKQRSGNISNTHINEIYDLARENGALGGKLIGAGGGGFLMFYAEDKTRLRGAMEVPVCARCEYVSISRGPCPGTFLSLKCYRLRFLRVDWRLVCAP